MINRFKEALASQNASNPSGLAFSLMAWQREILDAGGNTEAVRTDPACRLLVYQLACLMNVDNLDDEQYGKLSQECEARTMRNQ